MAGIADIQRNRDLLSELFAGSHHLLLSQARRHARLDTDAEEALQAACAIFLEKYHQPAEPLPWLMTTVKREAWRIAKRASRRRELAIAAVPRADGRRLVDLSDAIPDPRPGPCELAEAGERHRARRAALARLKPDERTALVLFGCGYSYAEIAMLRGWTYTKVNRCIGEGRRALSSVGARSEP